MHVVFLKNKNEEKSIFREKKKKIRLFDLKKEPAHTLCI